MRLRKYGPQCRAWIADADSQRSWIERRQGAIEETASVSQTKTFTVKTDQRRNNNGRDKLRAIGWIGDFP